MALGDVVGHLMLVECGRSQSVTPASSVTQDLPFANLLRWVDLVVTYCSHCILLSPITLQVDSPAQLANALVNVTDNSEEIASEDVSLTVGLLSTVTNSTEDLQQAEVIMSSCIHH